MLRVTVELVPFGLEHSPAKQVIATGIICNTGARSAGGPLGDYHVKFDAHEANGYGKPPFYPALPRSWELKGEGLVKAFPRHEYSVWDLVHAALGAAGLDRGEPS